MEVGHAWENEGDEAFIEGGENADEKGEVTSCACTVGDAGKEGQAHTVVSFVVAFYHRIAVINYAHVLE